MSCRLRGNFIRKQVRQRLGSWRLRPRLRRRGNQRGQAIIEYILLLTVAFFFAKFIFFDPNFGFYGMLNRTMVRLGGHLEGDLKSGTQPGNQGARSDEGYAGTANWNN